MNCAEDGGANANGIADGDDERFVPMLEYEASRLWASYPILAVLTLTLPVWAAILAAIGAFVVGGMTLVRQLTVAALASMAAGRFLIWTGDADPEIGFTHVQLALLVLVMDIIWAIVLTWHAGALLRVPWIGHRLRLAVHEGGLLLKRNRWMKRLTVVAVFCFVMLPISSTGSIGGSLLGRLLGLSRTATLATVFFGSVCGGSMMLAFAQALAPVFESGGWVVRYGGIAFIVLMGFVLSRRYRRTLES